VSRSSLAIGIGLLVIVAGGLAALFLAPWPEPEVFTSGISLTLAEDRAARVSSLKYDLSLSVPVSRTAPVRGQVTASFTLRDASRSLAFDFGQPADRLLNVTANGQTLAARLQNGHIVIPSGGLIDGANVITLSFLAGDESLNRNDEFLYSLFVPARASLAIPCFDQPDLKARWRLSLDIPSGWTAVSNSREASPFAPGQTGLVFEETQPLPTYLFGFAAGRFSVETAERQGRTFRMFHRETDAAKIARNSAAIFDLHAQALGWLEEYTGIPYAFGKFDFVLIPSFQFGGMEHAGAIYYNAAGLMLDETATQNQRLGRASVIAHETSHMWFGDLVTMKWFNDVWMKEVFANVMAAKIVNPSFPTVNHDLRFLFQNYPVAYDVDRTEGSNPIRQDLANLNEAGSLYGAIIYQKAPIVMRQLELLMGADAFRDGLREYLKAHAFGNATWSDLVSTLDARTPEDVAAWSRAWVEEPGRPTVRTRLDVSAGRVNRLSFVQEDARARNLAWPERLQVIVGVPDGPRTFDVTIAGGETVVPEAAGLPVPDWVLPVGLGLGYAFFDLDETTKNYLAASLHEIRDPLTRGAALVALWESMLEGGVAPSSVLQELRTALPREPDELNVQQMLDYLRAAFWRFVPASDRLALAPGLETLLRAGLDRAATTGAKAAWFGALRSIALSPETLAWLKQVWSHEATIAGLPLAEPDEADLALDLALREVPDTAMMLDDQLLRFKNPDRRDRFQFVIPALSADPAVRDAFFAGLKDVKNRTHEAWVLDAVRYLNHPLRAASSRKYIPAALDLVREIQRTGDIFFPKRWADAALGGYQSGQEAAQVRAFIDSLPADYPPRLRWVLLSAADPLFRAATLLK